MNARKIVTIWYAGFAIIAEEMLFLFTAFIFIWTILCKTSIHAIKLCPVTKWRKCVKTMYAGWLVLDFSFRYKKVWNLKSKALVAWSLKVDLVFMKHQDVEIIYIE